MKWYNKLINCVYMFKDLINTIEIDLTNFDSSDVETMEGMFYGCTNLKNIIMKNIFNTNKVTTMSYMFYLCESLTSIDLSNFNTHSVENTAYFLSDCILLTSLDLSNFDTSSVINMNGMLKNCFSLKSINLSNINTSKVSSMSYLFSNCFSLTSLDISSFNTSKTIYMSNMFYNCSSLKSLDLTNFKTESVKFMASMFYNCYELIELNLSNFDTSNTLSFYQMFYNCQKLVSLDISNFDMRNINYMIDMFYDCNNLEYINFNNSIENINANISNIFYGIQKKIVYCSNNEENIAKIIEEFKERTCIINDCTNDWKKKRKKIIEEKNTCINDCKEDNEYFYENKIKCYKSCPVGTHLLYYINFLCIRDCPENFPFEKDDECIDSCSAYEFFNKLCRISNHVIQAKQIITNTITNEITNNILNNLLISMENSDIIINDQSEIYQLTNSFNQNNNNYNDIAINLGECENILKEKYNIDNSQNLIIFKMEYKIEDFQIPIIEYQVFHTITKELLNLTYCKNTKININIPVSIEEEYLYKYNPYSEYYFNNCYPNLSECSNNNDNNLLNKRKDEFNNNYLSLCEKNCEYKEYNSNSKIVSCECGIKNKFSLLSEIINEKNNLLYNFIINTEGETNIGKNIDECIIEEFFNHKCTFNNTIEAKQKIINMIRGELFKGTLDKLINASLIQKKEDLLVEQKDIVYQVTSTENQKNKEYLNISVIDLKECENKLKRKYNIDTNESLIIFKIDDFINEIKIPIVEYEIYHPVTKEVLDLKICKDSPIDISYPVSINEDEIFKYDPNSNYYNDKCFPYTTENGTDITLNDRKHEYNDKNLSLCENNCAFIEYDKEKKRALCECEPKTIFEELINIEIDKDKLLNKFIDFKSTTNFDVIFCLKTFFCLDGIKINIGSYILIIIIIINGICMGIFYKKGYKEIDENIQNIKNEKFENNKKLDNKKKEKINIKSNNKNKNKNLRISTDNNKNIFDINIIKKVEMNKKVKKNPPKKKKNNILNTVTNNISNSSIANNSKNKLGKIINNFDFNKKNKAKNKLKKKSNNKMNYLTDKEINSFKYEEALKFDKRTYIQYYISLLKEKHLLIFCFITKNDYNSRLNKICFFFFSFALLFIINSFFFQDKEIHKIYENKGTFDFIYQIPQILYSTIISAVITLLIKFLSLSDSKVIELKKSNNIEDFNKVIKCLTVKIIIFYVLHFLLLLLFWYYLDCFCAVFRNTQFNLLEDTLISLLLSFIYQLILNLLPGIFRISSLKKHKTCLYHIGKIIQYI